MNIKLDLFDKDAVQQFIYGILVENRLLHEEAERQGALKEIYYRDYVNEAGRADEMRKRSERAEAVLKRIIEILDTAQREGYTPETLEAAIDKALNEVREAMGGENNEQPL